MQSNDLLLKDVATPNGLDSSSVLRSQSINQREHSMDEHFVQFYESEAFLIDSIASFVSSGFDSGDIVLVLATAPHLNALRARLLEKQTPIDLFENVGFFVQLDAEKVRADLTVDGVLSSERFNQFFGSLLSQARDTQRPIRVFGELVAVLWAQGKYATAIQVEKLWNGLKTQQPFSLFCAYPLQGFAGKDLAEPLEQVCLTHSRIIPAESYTSLNSLDEKLHSIIHLQQKSVSLKQEISEHRKTREELRATKADLKLRLTNLEEALQRERMYREKEAANRLKDEFLATVSHELRTPLNAIIGWSHLLNQGRLDASTSTTAMESIERNAKAEAQMIEDLFDVSRLAAGTLKLNVAEVELAVVIHEAINSLISDAEAKAIKVVVEADPACEPIIADSRRLQQIIRHLLDNAIKFSAPNGRVCVQLKQTQQEVEIAVEDSGQGIEAECLDCVFEKFWQADSSTTRRHGGLGVGLSIVRYLVELHGGLVTVESKGRSHGSRFLVRLPSGSRSR